MQCVYLYIIIILFFISCGSRGKNVNVYLSNNSYEYDKIQLFINKEKYIITNNGIDDTDCEVELINSDSIKVEIPFFKIDTTISNKSFDCVFLSFSYDLKTDAYISSIDSSFKSSDWKEMEYYKFNPFLSIHICHGSTFSVKGVPPQQPTD